MSVISDPELNIPRPGTLIPPGSPSRQECTGQDPTFFSRNEEFENCFSGLSLKDNEIFNGLESPLSPDNQEISQMLLEFAEKDEDYVGIEVISAFAVWQTEHQKQQNTKPLDNEKPVLYIRNNGTPTPGTLPPFWNQAIIRSICKDGPGNNTASNGKKYPVTVAVCKDRYVAVNHGKLAEEAKTLAGPKSNPFQFLHNGTMMELIAGHVPSMVSAKGRDFDDCGPCTELIRELEKESERPTEPNEYYLYSKCLAYLVLDYQSGIPTLKCLTQSELKKKLEDMKKEGSTFAQEKFTPLLNIKRIEGNAHDWPFTIALYYCVENTVYFVHVDEKELNLVVEKSEEVEWGKHLQFTEHTILGIDEVDKPRDEVKNDDAIPDRNGVDESVEHHLPETSDQQNLVQKADDLGVGVDATPVSTKDQDKSQESEGLSENTPHSPTVIKSKHQIPMATSGDMDEPVTSTSELQDSATNGTSQQHNGYT